VNDNAGDDGKKSMETQMVLPFAACLRRGTCPPCPALDWQEAQRLIAGITTNPVKEKGKRLGFVSKH
jgi:hypothetical protein